MRLLLGPYELCVQPLLARYKPPVRWLCTPCQAAVCFLFRPCLLPVRFQVAPRVTPRPASTDFLSAPCGSPYALSIRVL
jgi:hypothetical protein